MVTDDFGDFRVCETRVLSDYGLLMVLAVKDKSCRKKKCQQRVKDSSDKSKYWDNRKTVIRKHIRMWCKYRFLVVEPLDPADRDRSSLVNPPATSPRHSSSEVTIDLPWKNDCWSRPLETTNECGALVIRSPPKTPRPVVSERRPLAGWTSSWGEPVWETGVHSLQVWSSRRA